MYDVIFTSKQYLHKFRLKYICIGDFLELCKEHNTKIEHLLAENFIEIINDNVRLTTKAYIYDIVR